MGAELGDGRTDTTGGSLEDVSVHSDSRGRGGTRGGGLGTVPPLIGANDPELVNKRYGNTRAGGGRA